MFTDKISTEIIIGAPADTIWTILTKFDSWKDWNPFITDLKLREGQEFAVGCRLDGQWVDKPGGKVNPMNDLELLTLEPGTEFMWQAFLFGSMGWLFTGQHTFKLEALPDGTTKFTNEEQIGGFLVPIMRVANVVESVKKQFDAMNEALKEQAENA